MTSPWALSKAMTAPLVITLACPGVQSAFNDAGVSPKRHARLPATGCNGDLGGIEGSESIAGWGVSSSSSCLQADGCSVARPASRDETTDGGRGGDELEREVAELGEQLLQTQLGSSLDDELLPERARETLAQAAADALRATRHAELHGGEGREVTVRHETDRRRSGSHPVAGRGGREGRKGAVAGERLREVHRHAGVERGVGGTGCRRDRRDGQRWRRERRRRRCPLVPRTMAGACVKALQPDESPGGPEGDDQDDARDEARDAPTPALLNGLSVLPHAHSGHSTLVSFGPGQL